MKIPKCGPDVVPPVPCPLPHSLTVLVAQFSACPADTRRRIFTVLTGAPAAVGLACVATWIRTRPKSKGLRLPRWGTSRATRRLRRDLVATKMGVWGKQGEHTPKVLQRSANASGEELLVEFRPGMHAGVFDGEGKDSGAEVLASAFGAQHVQVARHPDNARWATISIMARNPLTETRITPLADATHWDWQGGVPVGTSVKGHEVGLNLAWRNILVSGAPDAGKSGIIAALAAAAALDIRIKLYLFDANRVNLSPWKGCAEAFVTADHGHAIGVLERLLHELERRSGILDDLGVEKLPMEGDLRELVVIMDEISFFLADASHKKDSAYTTALLTEIVRRGRYVGIEVVAATQRPSVQVVAGDLRDLFVWRWALYCHGLTAYTMALGEDHAGEGSAIRMDNPGEGLLLHQGGSLEHLRAYHTPGDVRRALAARALALRSQGTESVARELSRVATVDSPVRLSVVRGGGSEATHNPQPTLCTSPQQPTGYTSLHLSWLPTERDYRILERLAEGPRRKKAIDAEFFAGKRPAGTQRMTTLAQRGVMTAAKVRGPANRGDEVEYTITEHGREVLATQPAPTAKERGG